MRSRRASRRGRGDDRLSGLAQTRAGYVQGIEATRRKVRADLAYISRAGFRLDMLVAWHTFKMVVTRAGT